MEVYTWLELPNRTMAAGSLTHSIYSLRARSGLFQISLQNYWCFSRDGLSSFCVLCRLDCRLFESHFAETDWVLLTELWFLYLVTGLSLQCGMYSPKI